MCIRDRLRAVESEIFYNILPLGLAHRRKLVYVICGANYAIRRKALESVGFHGKKTLGEDYELTLKLASKDWEIRIANANVWQEEVENLREYVRQRLRWYDTGVRATRLYFNYVKKIWKKRPLDILLFYFLPSIVFFGLFYLLISLIPGLLWTGILGFILTNTAIIIGLIKLKRYFLIPYVPLYLIIEPFLISYCLLLRMYILKVKKGKIEWKSIAGKYYHKGRRIVMK